MGTFAPILGDRTPNLPMMVVTLVLLSLFSLGRASPSSLHGVPALQDRFSFGLMKPSSSPSTTAPWWSGFWPNNGGYFGFGIFGNEQTTTNADITTSPTLPTLPALPTGILPTLPTAPMVTTKQCGGLLGGFGLFCDEDTTTTSTTTSASPTNSPATTTSLPTI